METEEVKGRICGRDWESVGETGNSQGGGRKEGRQRRHRYTEDARVCADRKRLCIDNSDPGEIKNASSSNSGNSTFDAIYYGLFGF